MRKHIGLWTLLALLLVLLLFQSALAESGDGTDPGAGEDIAVQLNVYPEGAGVPSYDAETHMLGCTSAMGYYFKEWRYAESEDAFLEGVEAPERFGEAVHSFAAYPPQASGVYTAVMAEVPRFSLTVNASEGGHVTTTPPEGFELSGLPAGAPVTLTWEMDEGYYFMGITVSYVDTNGVQQSYQPLYPFDQVDTFTYSMMGNDVTLDVWFEQVDTHALTVEAPEHGQIEAVKPEAFELDALPEGLDIGFMVSVDVGYDLVSLELQWMGEDGEPVDVIVPAEEMILSEDRLCYDFTMPNADVSVRANCEMRPCHAMSVMDGEHGHLEVSVEGGFELSAIPEGVMTHLVLVPDEGYAPLGLYIYWTTEEGGEELSRIPVDEGVFEAEMEPCDIRVKPLFTPLDMLEPFLLTMDYNDGRGEWREDTVSFGVKYHLPSGTPRRDGYIFMGWNTEPDGSGTDYAPGESIYLESDMTLYASWVSKDSWKYVQMSVERDGYAEINFNIEAQPGDTPLVIGPDQDVTLRLGAYKLILEKIDGCPIVVDGGTLTIEGDGGSSGGGLEAASFSLQSQHGSIMLGESGIENHGVLNLQCVFVDGGGAAEYGILSDDTLDLFNSVVMNCAGDGVINEGSAGLTDSMIRSNAGAGIVNRGNLYAAESSICLNSLGVDNSGDAELSNCQIYRNHGALVGGIKTAGQMQLTDCMIFRNTGDAAGGVYADDEVGFNGSTIFYNTAARQGGAGGILLAEGENAHMTIDRALMVMSNTCDGAASNLRLPLGNSPIRFIGELAEGTNSVTSLGLSSDASEQDVVVLFGDTDLLNSGEVFSDDPDYVIGSDEDGNILLTRPSETAHTVTYMLDEDTVYAKVTVEHGGAAPYLYPEKEDYEFSTWLLEDGTGYDLEHIEEDITLCAQWYQSDVSSWDQFRRRMAQGGTIRLGGDIQPDTPEEPREIVVPAGVSTTLDLNKHTVDGTRLFNTVITVEPGAELTVIDSGYNSPDFGGGQICALNNYSSGAIMAGSNNCAVDVGGTFNLGSGYIAGSQALTGVHVRAGGVFNMTGGSVADNLNTRYGGVFNEGTFNFRHGHILNCFGWDGAAVTNKGTFSMSGGTIANCGGKYANAVANYGTFTLSGGKLKENNYNGAMCGGIYNAGGAVAAMSGGELYDNITDGCGAVYNMGTFTLTGGTIRRNGGWNRGTGGIVQQEGELAISGGCITNNFGVEYGGVSVLGGRLRLSGDPFIFGNYCSDDTSNLYLSGDKLIEIDGALGDGLRVGVGKAMSDKAGAHVTLTASLEGNGGVEGFISDYRYAQVALNDGEAALTPMPQGDIHEVTFAVDGIPRFTQYVPDGECAKPVDTLGEPDKALMFWYVDGLEGPFAFDTPIHGDLVLEAAFQTLCLVEYSAEGGVGYIEPEYVPYGTEILLPYCPFTPPAGKTFSGWNSSNSNTLQSGDSLTVDQDMCICATWDYETYDVVVDTETEHGSLMTHDDTYLFGDTVCIELVAGRDYAIESLTYESGGVTKTIDLVDFNVQRHVVYITPEEPGTLHVTASFYRTTDICVVTIYKNDGSGDYEVLDDLAVGDLLPEPDYIPERREATFRCWSVLGTNEPYDFSAPLTDRLELTAAWDPRPSGNVDVQIVGGGSAVLTAGTEIYGETATFGVYPGQYDRYAFAGETITCTLTAEEGFAAGSVTVTDSEGNPVEVAEDFSFVMPESDITVTVSFEVTGAYSINVVAENIRTGMGTLTARGRSDAGKEIPFSISVESGCYIKSFTLEYTLNGEAVTESMVNKSSFTMPEADVTLRAVFSDYAVTVNPLENGTVILEEDGYRAGSAVTMSVNPAEGYYLERLTVKNGAGKAVEVIEDSFTMPASDVTIDATFRQIGLYYVDFNTGTKDLVVARQEIWDGGYATEPSASETERLGYVFRYWHLSGETEPFDFEHRPITGDTTLIAEWEKLCRVSYIAYGKPCPDSYYVHSGEFIEEPVMDELDGYTFQGFYDGSHRFEQFDFSQPITADTSIYVRWARNVSSWAELVTCAKDGEEGDVILVSDITRGENQSSIITKRSYSFSIDLNGHTLDVNRFMNTAIVTENSCFLYLWDSQGGGKITGAVRPVIHAAYDARVFMYGGAISGNTISPIAGTNCGVVYVAGGGYFYMYGGVIENNTAGYDGGAICIDGYCSIGENAIIRNNTAGNGGAICCNGSLYVNGGQIIDNTATNVGGGIYCGPYSDYLKVEGGEISGNNARIGGGIYSFSGDILLWGGTVTGNKATESGGGISVHSSNFDPYRNPVVTDNTLTDGTPSNVHLSRVGAFSNGGFTEEARMGFTVLNAPTYSAPVVLTNGLRNRATADTFFSDNPDYEVVINPDTGEAELRLPAPEYIEPGFILPRGIAFIEESAFEGFAAESVYIPDGIYSIGPNAFKDSVALRQIRIPESVSVLDDTAFDGCVNLKAIYGGTKAKALADRLDAYYGGEIEND